MRAPLRVCVCEAHYTHARASNSIPWTWYGCGGFLMRKCVEPFGHSGLHSASLGVWGFIQIRWNKNAEHMFDYGIFGTTHRHIAIYVFTFVMEWMPNAYSYTWQRRSNMQSQCLRWELPHIIVSYSACTIVSSVYSTIRRTYIQLDVYVHSAHHRMPSLFPLSSPNIQMNCKFIPQCFWLNV